MICVAVVDDEPLTRRAITAGLQQEEFEIHQAADAFACRTLMQNTRVDVVVLDLGLPGIDGMAFARELSAGANVGLIIVTKREGTEARIEALDTGADDYLVKPVHYGELAARIRSVMRRRRVHMPSRKKIGDWVVDLEARTANRGEEAAGLTRGEFDILAQLIEANGKIVSRESLLSAVSRRPHAADLRSVDALISRIRRKLGDGDGGALIVTAPGFGYRLQSPASAL